MPTLAESLRIEIPIFQAPTASIAGPELAAAVSAAGGLGSMGLTWSTADDAASAIRFIRDRTDQPFMVNYALAFEPVTLPVALDRGAPIVSLSWGDPTPYAARIHTAGALLAVQVGSVQGALLAQSAGADVIICQGIEAGGHVQSSIQRDSLVRAVRAACGASAAIVAAGGIATGEEIAAALAAGASGVMLGTRFVATRESRAHPDYKRLLVGAFGLDATALTICFDGGWPHAMHRVLRNATLADWKAPDRRRQAAGRARATQSGRHRMASPSFATKIRRHARECPAIPKLWRSTPAPAWAQLRTFPPPAIWCDSSGTKRFSSWTAVARGPESSRRPLDNGGAICYDSLSQRWDHPVVNGTAEFRWL